MITADQIRDLRTASSDYAETQELLSRFESLSKSRRPFFLTGEEADLVFRWKLRSQYGRQKALRDANPEEAYRAVTRATFEIVADDPDVETEIRLGILTSLRGVGVPVASAILALVEPHKYPYSLAGRSAWLPYTLQWLELTDRPDATGHFRIEEVHPGAYRASFGRFTETKTIQERRWIERKGVDIDVKPGATVTIDLE